jgi:prepilin-type N-terminal cleavage/methylation domain-containing protein/prepilin-type processing-associated H-X9-DG protein
MKRHWSSALAGVVLRSPQSGRAFTLIELLVCIGVIAILASLLMPALARARNRAQSITCLNNLKQLSIACLVYTDDYRDRLPYNQGSDEIREAVARNWYYNWTSPIMSWELDSDNTNTVLVTRGGIGPYTSGAARIYRCPVDSVVSDIQAEAGWTRRVRSISLNAMVGDAGEYSMNGTNVNNPGFVQFFKTTQIQQPSQIFMFIEEHPDSINDGYFLNRLAPRLRWTDLPASYHDGAANLTFVDGHAEKRSWKSPTTRPAPRPDSAGLPFTVRPKERVDFDWLSERTSVASQ